MQIAAASSSIAANVHNGPFETLADSVYRKAIITLPTLTRDMLYTIFKNVNELNHYTSTHTS